MSERGGPPTNMKHDQHHASGRWETTYSFSVSSILDIDRSHVILQYSDSPSSRDEATLIMCCIFPHRFIFFLGLNFQPALHVVPTTTIQVAGNLFCLSPATTRSTTLHITSMSTNHNQLQQHQTLNFIDQRRVIQSPCSIF